MQYVAVSLSYDIIIIAHDITRCLDRVKLGWILVQIIVYWCIYFFFVNTEATFQRMEYKRVFLYFWNSLNSVFKKTHDFRQSVDWFFSHESVATHDLRGEN
jgi:hypothetical protein